MVDDTSKGVKQAVGARGLRAPTVGSPSPARGEGMEGNGRSASPRARTDQRPLHTLPRKRRGVHPAARIQSSAPDRLRARITGHVTQDFRNDHGMQKAALGHKRSKSAPRSAGRSLLFADDQLTEDERLIRDTAAATPRTI